MKPIILLAASAALLLAACGQTTAPVEEAPAAPQALMDQVLAMAPEQQPVFAYQQLAAYQQAHPEATPICSAVRATEARGIIPDDVDPASTYGPFAGGAVYSVQCGALLSQTRYDPTEHWLVAFMPGAAEPTIVNCADASGRDQCPAQIPRAAAPPSP
ncbi:MAG: hypothetical protein NW206_15390 [Hyphomonadaceae bacterium]|nr:hypothetical protein [Hyphomonadaceae bacterium]